MCELEVDTKGAKYVGISLDWDYAKGKVHLSIPGYLAEALHHFEHIWSRKIEDQPYAHITLNYGVKVQYAPDDDTSQPAAKEEEKFDQQVVGTFLYYGHAVDGTM